MRRLARRIDGMWTGYTFRSGIIEQSGGRKERRSFTLLKDEDTVDKSDKGAS